MPTVAEVEVQAFFFEAMRHGWVAGYKSQRIKRAPGTKAVAFYQGEYFLEDRFCTSHDSRNSAGTTTIWHRGVPVWIMQYLGQYNDEDIPFLMSVLLEAYQEEMFNGGRGPEHVAGEGGRSYQNQVGNSDQFGNFIGLETIRDADGTLLGWHRYHGISLL